MKKKALTMTAAAVLGVALLVSGLTYAMMGMGGMGQGWGMMGRGYMGGGMGFGHGGGSMGAPPGSGYPGAPYYGTPHRPGPQGCPWGWTPNPQQRPGLTPPGAPVYPQPPTGQ